MTGIKNAVGILMLSSIGCGSITPSGCGENGLERESLNAAKK
jgi:hypothetical protein